MKIENVIKIITDIEDKDIRYISKEWYYHASKYEYDKYRNILTNGILCNYLLMNKSSKYNGKYYISVCKNLECDYDCSSYLQYLESVPMFILNENIDAIETQRETLLGLSLVNTRSTHRISEFDDEYQVPFKISAESIIGIEYYLNKIIKYKMIKENVITPLFEVKSLVKLLDKLNLDIPIYDYSTYKEINKDKVLKLEI